MYKCLTKDVDTPLLALNTHECHLNELDIPDTFQWKSDATKRSIR